jgi:drug/metabolite transporter (DMT)-like permease
MQRVWLAIVVASLGWGTAGVATRFALIEGVTPYRLAAYRSLFAVVAVIIYLLVSRGKVPRGAVVWKVGTVMGLSNLAAPFIFSNLALQYAGAGFLGLMTALIPLITAGLAHFTLPGERLSIVKTVGLVLGFSGVAVLFLSGDTGLADGGRPVIAGFLGMGAVVSISAGGVYAKHHAGEYEPLDVTGVHFATGTVIIALITLVAEGGPAGATGKAWLLLVYMALASTFLPMILYYWMLRHVTATYASLAGYVIPIIAITAGVVLLDEQLQSGIILGGLLILVGVLITDRAERRPKLETPQGG